MSALFPSISTPVSFISLNITPETVLTIFSSSRFLTLLAPASVNFGAIAFIFSFTVYISLGLTTSFSISVVTHLEKSSGITIDA